MRRLVALLLVCAALVTPAACVVDISPLTGPTSVAGKYTLRTVNGSPLPYTMMELGDDKYEITAGTLTLEEGGTWKQSGADRMTEGTSVVTSTFEVAGTYSRTGPVLTFVSEGTGTFSGSVEGDKVSVSQDGHVAVYTK
jgi:hypothetical protein